MVIIWLEVTNMDTYTYLVNYRKEKKLSQDQFSKIYQIPVSTLRKWEQKESKPSKYFIRMLMNEDKNTKQCIKFSNGKERYIYDYINNIIYDKLNTGIKLHYDVRKISKDRVFIMLEQLFRDYYTMIGKFDIQCVIDKEQKGKWHRLK